MADISNLTRKIMILESYIYNYKNISTGSKENKHILSCESKIDQCIELMRKTNNEINRKKN